MENFEKLIFTHNAQQIIALKCVLAVTTYSTRVCIRSWQNGQIKFSGYKPTSGRMVNTSVEKVEVISSKFVARDSILLTTINMTFVRWSFYSHRLLSNVFSFMLSTVHQRLLGANHFVVRRRCRRIWKIIFILDWFLTVSIRFDFFCVHGSHNTELHSSKSNWLIRNWFER